MKVVQTSQQCYNADHARCKGQIPITKSGIDFFECDCVCHKRDVAISNNYDDEDEYIFLD